LATLVVLASGLAVHFGGAALPTNVRDVAGDALWAAMIWCGFGVMAPSWSLMWRTASAYTVCLSVECSQLWHTPALDAVRATTLGHLVLGSDFDARDLVAYAAGVLLAALVERVARRAG
jgi:hypothetical protein